MCKQANSTVLELNFSCTYFSVWPLCEISIVILKLLRKESWNNKCSHTIPLKEFCVLRKRRKSSVNNNWVEIIQVQHVLLYRSNKWRNYKSGWSCECHKHKKKYFVQSPSISLNSAFSFSFSFTHKHINTLSPH